MFNIVNGYSKTNNKGFEVTSAPILIFDLVPIIKNARNLQTPIQSEDFIKADTLL